MRKITKALLSGAILTIASASYASTFLYQEAWYGSPTAYGYLHEAGCVWNYTGATGAGQSAVDFHYSPVGNCSYTSKFVHWNAGTYDVQVFVN